MSGAPNSSASSASFARLAAETEYGECAATAGTASG